MMAETMAIPQQQQQQQQQQAQHGSTAKVLVRLAANGLLR
jgi:hypothetical protein